MNLKLIIIFTERDKPLHFPQINISNPKSVEPDSIFRIECNISNNVKLSSIHWYQENKPIIIDNKKYFMNLTHLNKGIFSVACNFALKIKFFSLRNSQIYSNCKGFITTRRFEC